jgi:SAM-dependent methyltransferase
LSRHIQLRELLVGIEGLALLRHLYDGSDEAAKRRLAEIRALLDDETCASSEVMIETNPVAGYGSWAESYGDPGNPIIELEQGIVWGMLESRPAGRALDAACGTGRHAGRLVELGHEVVGIDASAEMLRRAVVNVPQASFMEGDLRAIPAPSEQFELVVCGLALAHLEDLGPAIGELGRVLRPGGRLVISVLHPLQALLGWQAPFLDARGRRRFIREYPHTHADYVTGFRAADLHLRSCVEPTLTETELAAKRRAFKHIPEATVAAYLGLPGVLVWEVEKGPG